MAMLEVPSIMWIHMALAEVPYTWLWLRCYALHMAVAEVAAVMALLAYLPYLRISSCTSATHLLEQGTHCHPPDRIMINCV